MVSYLHPMILVNGIRYLIGTIWFTFEYIYHTIRGICLESSERWVVKGHPLYDHKSNPMISFHYNHCDTFNHLIDPPQELRIGCLNMHYSNCNDKLVQWCRDLDICCFQEATGNQSRNITVLDALSQKTEYNYHFFETEYSCKSWCIGNGTLSRIPWKNIILTLTNG